MRIDVNNVYLCRKDGLEPLNDGLPVLSCIITHQS